MGKGAAVGILMALALFGGGMVWFALAMPGNQLALSFIGGAMLGSGLVNALMVLVRRRRL